jgi:nucleotide-binding universal stress UspA family protein
MKYEKILVPYDGSENAKHAVEYAADMLTRYPDAKIIAFASLAGPHDINNLLGGTAGTVEFGAGKEVTEHYKKMRQENYDRNMARLQEEVGAIVADKDAVEYHLDYSVSPIKGILAAIKAYEADIVIMGCRGTSAIAGVLGSVTFGVIRSADIPVTVVK